MTESPRDYDREFTTPLNYRARRRIGYSHEQGDVTRFVVQIEYRLTETWSQVVRFDHDPQGKQGHDVTTEGVHMDVSRDGEKIRSPDVPTHAGGCSAYECRRAFEPARRTIYQEV